MLNKVQLIGLLGKDPEVSYTTSGIAVAKFSLATNEKWKDADGNKQERTEWHNIVAWRTSAELAGKYLFKGSKVFIEGKIKTESWEKDGKKNYKTTIVVDNFIFLDSKKDAGTQQERPEANAIPEKDDLPF